MINLLNIAKTRQKYSRINDSRTLALTRQGPVYVVFTGDWHLGAPGTDYELFEKDLKVLAHAKQVLGENLVIVGMGDYVDGYTTKGPKLEHDQVLSPWEQRMAAKQALETLQPDLVLIGDHDFWLSGGEDGYNWLHDWSMENKVPYAEWGGELEIWTGEIVWRILVRHRYKGGVNGLDHLKPHKNLFTEGGPAHAVVLAHFHTKAGVYRINPVRNNEGRYWGIQTGTYKLHDTYGKKISSGIAEYGVPALVLTKNEILAYDHYLEALPKKLWSKRG